MKKVKLAITLFSDRALATELHAGDKLLGKKAFQFGDREVVSADFVLGDDAGYQLSIELILRPCVLNGHGSKVSPRRMTVGVCGIGIRQEDITISLASGVPLDVLVAMGNSPKVYSGNPGRYWISGEDINVPVCIGV